MKLHLIGASNETCLSGKIFKQFRACVDLLETLRDADLVKWWDAKMRGTVGQVGQDEVFNGFLSSRAQDTGRCTCLVGLDCQCFGCPLSLTIVQSVIAPIEGALIEY